MVVQYRGVSAADVGLTGEFRLARPDLNNM